jgi:hypothetical protein
MEEAGTNPLKDERAERRLLTSKMKSLNNQLNLLTQKKLRLDIEIKRTKKKLSKIKKSSMTNIQAKLQIEGFDYSKFSPDDLNLLREQVGPEEYEELLELDKEIDEADIILQSIDSPTIQGEEVL